MDDQGSQGPGAGPPCHVSGGNSKPQQYTKRKELLDREQIRKFKKQAAICQSNSLASHTAHQLAGRKTRARSKTQPPSGGGSQAPRLGLGHPAPNRDNPLPRRKQRWCSHTKEKKLPVLSRHPKCFRLHLPDLRWRPQRQQQEQHRYNALSIRVKTPPFIQC